MKKLSVSVPAGLRKGLEQVKKTYPRRFGTAGYKVRFAEDASLKPGGLRIVRAGKCAEVTYGRPVDAFRALGILLGEDDAAAKNDICQTAKFDTMGLMIDASRNGVATVDTVKALLVRSALMGINVCMMYCEDTYEVPGEPFFGYLRGAYTRKEMKTLDDFAFSLGIEMFPCIQALAHLEQILQWPAYHEYRDNEFILLAEDEKTYVLVEKMIKAASAPFRSRRIHVGMDEAHGLGQGRFKQLKGEKRSFDIMNTHLTKVRDICKGLGLAPIIWSDMYFRLGSKDGGYYDKEWSIPADVVKDIPKDVQLVYWDYYHTDYEFYCEWIKRHRSLGSEPIVAPGSWTWDHFWAELDFADKTIRPCMQACRDMNVKEVIMTNWGDNGMEVDLYSALPAWQLFAEYGYTDKVTPASLAANFRGSCDADYASWCAGAGLERLPGIKNQPVNPAKYLLWMDTFLGMWEPQLPMAKLPAHYDKICKRLKDGSRLNGGDARLLHPAQLARVLSIKSGLRSKLVKAYKKRDKAGLKKIVASDLLTLRREVEKLWLSHREMWLSTYKPFGLEVVEMRYGALRTRLQSLEDRLKDYIAGRIASIPEFETKLVQAWPRKKGEIPHIGNYRRIISPSFIV